MRRTVRSLALVLTLLSVPAAGEQPEVVFEPLAVTVLPAPGFPAGTTFLAVGYPTLDSAGQVAFTGGVFKPDGDRDDGIVAVIDNCRSVPNPDQVPRPQRRALCAR